MKIRPAEHLDPLCLAEDFTFVQQTCVPGAPVDVSGTTWTRSPETGKLLELRLGGNPAVQIQINLARKEVFVRNAPVAAGYESYRALITSNLLTGIFWTLSGKVALHANAVGIDDNRIVAFTGNSGRGKSTLTAYLIAQGMAFVTDDILMVDESDRIKPAGDIVKLWPSSLLALELNDIPRTTTKEFLNVALLGGRVFDGKGRLSHVFELAAWDGTDRVAAERVNAAASPLVLLQNGYYPTLLMQDCPELFYTYSDLAARIEVYRLHYPRTPGALPQVRRLIEEVVHGS